MAMGIFVLFITAVVVAAQEEFEMDIIETSGGNLKITFIGHGTLMFTFGGKVIHVDPFSRLADYAKLPKADMILITHEHRDHLDLKALKTLRTEKTTVILTKTCSRQVEGGIVMNNRDVKSVEGLKIEAVPAYNIIHKREK
jgi:L-ascorbate metabolism protein UlaG (beta-lactamase superfamily)